jgi:hypothetical protein
MDAIQYRVATIHYSLGEKETSASFDLTRFSIKALVEFFIVFSRHQWRFKSPDHKRIK